MKERLHKVMAQAGIASRRACEELIRQGRVTVNGAVITRMGLLVDPAHDQIRVEGRPLPSLAACTYIALYKPPGVLSTARDTHGRPTVLDLVQPAPNRSPAPERSEGEGAAEGSPSRLYPVGRLDLGSEGLILLTDDGELAQRLTHPRYEQSKEYRVCVAGHPSRETVRRWQQGLWLDDRRTAPAEVSVLHREPGCTWLRVILHEGRKREIRRIAEILGHRVRRLMRVRLGSLHLGDLRPGEWRHLTRREVERLRQAAGLGRDEENGL